MSNADDHGLTGVEWRGVGVGGGGGGGSGQVAPAHIVARAERVPISGTHQLFHD